MNRRLINATDAPAAAGGYAQAVEITSPSRLLFISGQIPVTTAEEVPGTFAEQGRLAWQNLEAQLRAADMTLDNLVKVTVYLADRQYALENRVVRQAALGGRQIAMTVVIAGIFDPGWLLEIEAIAAA
ncbi:MAG: RidA family protein [Chloroflexota bacterium]|nr:RidA family protein [Chloroflexota bacterium]